MLMQPNPESEMHQVTWNILNVVKHLSTGKLKLASFLKGSKSKLVAPIAGAGLYGGLMWYDIPTIEGFIDQLEDIGMIHRKIMQTDKYDYPVLELSESGRKVLEEQIPVLLQVRKRVKPITVGDSEKKTFELLRQGKNVSDIARERSLAESTIYQHFFRLIVNKYILSSDVLSQGTVIRVAAAATKFRDTPSVSQIKELLPEISYEEIRCALAGLRHEAKEEPSDNDVPKT